MIRVMIGGGAGAVVAVLAVAAWGFHGGYTAGAEWTGRNGDAPGLAAAVQGALVTVLYLGWLALPVGLVIGSLAAFGSLIARPRRRR